MTLQGDPSTLLLLGQKEKKEKKEKKLKKGWGPIEHEFQSDLANNSHYSNSSLVISRIRVLNARDPSGDVANQPTGITKKTKGTSYSLKKIIYFKGK